MGEKRERMVRMFLPNWIRGGSEGKGVHKARVCVCLYSGRGGLRACSFEKVACWLALQLHFSLS